MIPLESATLEMPSRGSRTVSEVNRMPASNFYGPGRSFPIPDGDKTRARAALQGVGRALAAGHITAAQAARIRARANHVLGKPAGKKSDSYVKAMTTAQGRMKPARKPDSTIARVQAKPTKPSGAAKLPGRLASAKAALKPGQSSGSRYRI